MAGAGRRGPPGRRRPASGWASAPTRTRFAGGPPAPPPRRWATGADSASSWPRRAPPEPLVWDAVKNDVILCRPDIAGKSTTRRDVIKRKKSPKKKAFFPVSGIGLRRGRSQKSSLSPHTHTFDTERGGRGGRRERRIREYKVHHVCTPRLGLCSSLLLEMVWSRRDGGGGGGGLRAHFPAASCGHSNAVCSLLVHTALPKSFSPFLASTDCAGVTQPFEGLPVLVSNAPSYHSASTAREHV